MVLHGAFAPASMPTTGTIAVDDPEAWAVRAVRDALVRGGVGVRDDAPALTAALLTWEAALLPAVQRSLLDSSNFAAEQSLRVLGAQTTGDGSLAGASPRWRPNCGRWSARPATPCASSTGPA